MSKENTESSQELILYEGDRLTDMSINSVSTVQPNVLLRTGVFTPEAKRSANKPKYREQDMSRDLSRLRIAEAEGYRSITLTGPRLSIETDFKVWRGIVWALNEHGYTERSVSMPFSVFAKRCGFKSKQLNAALRKRVEDSLYRIVAQTLAFSSGPARMKGMATGLILKAIFDFKRDIIEIVPDPDLWELYAIDHQVLLSDRVFSKLSRQQTAQCLFMFIEALPAKPYPVSFQRLRARLLLNCSVGEANRIIKKALDKLIAIGYLKGFCVKSEGDWSLIIEERNPKMLIEG